MSKFVDKFKYFIGIDDYEEEEFIEDFEDNIRTSCNNENKEI